MPRSAKNRESDRRGGRLRISAETRRPHRVVTFVTDAELEQLEDLASRHERSLSAIVHRMIAAQIKRGIDPY